jgi:hypothetical protein
LKNDQSIVTEAARTSVFLNQIQKLFSQIPENRLDSGYRSIIYQQLRVIQPSATSIKTIAVKLWDTGVQMLLVIYRSTNKI